MASERSTHTIPATCISKTPQIVSPLPQYGSDRARDALQTTISRGMHLSSAPTHVVSQSAEVRIFECERQVAGRQEDVPVHGKASRDMRHMRWRT